MFKRAKTDTKLRPRSTGRTSDTPVPLPHRFIAGWKLQHTRWLAMNTIHN